MPDANDFRSGGDCPPLVSTEWLAVHLGEPRLRVADASWYLPSAGRDARGEFEEQHIPGAVFLDLDEISDRSSPLPHMLPSAEAFARQVGALGIGNDDTLVVYDASGVNMSAPRAWWTFRVFGHGRVAVLDGGLGKWLDERRPVKRGAPRIVPAHFTARLDERRLRDRTQVIANLATAAEQIVDMRPADRFAGAAPEPRPGLRSGHIPGSRNVPFTTLVQSDGTVLPADELRLRLEHAGVRLDRPIVASCGSGTTACALLLNLERLGVRDASLYDGSWAEWGAPGDTPVESGS